MQIYKHILVYIDMCVCMYMCIDIGAHVLCAVANFIYIYIHMYACIHTDMQIYR